MTYLKCNICGTDMKVPVCCKEKMVYQDGVLICELCHSEDKIPLCCGKKMKFVI